MGANRKNRISAASKARVKDVQQADMAAVWMYRGYFAVGILQWAFAVGICSGHFAVGILQMPYLKTTYNFFPRIVDWILKRRVLHLVTEHAF